MFPQVTTSRLSTFAFTVAAFATLLLHSPTAAAQAAGAKKPAAPAAEEAGEENRADKLDVTDLEKKYWAAKDTEEIMRSREPINTANRAYRIRISSGGSASEDRVSVFWSTLPDPLCRFPRSRSCR